MHSEKYIDGSYLENNPTWHSEHSSWKAEKIIQIIERNRLTPDTICEVGCGAGQILAELQRNMDTSCFFSGYDISPQAIELSTGLSNDRLQFKLADITQEKGPTFDLLLLIDLIEHLEDYFIFLRAVREKAEYKILHIPLNLSVKNILNINSLLQVRDKTGHIHYFTKELALQMLREAGYDVLDYFYTAGAIELPTNSVTRRLAKWPRKLLYHVHNDLTVRVMGGYSLLVLAN